MFYPWVTDHARKLLLLAVAYAALFSFTGYADAEVLISEVLPDPASDWSGDGVVDSRDDEWIEVVNTGPDTVDLGNYWIRDALGDAAQMCLSGVLAPGETALFTGADALAWQQANGIVLTGLSLNNSGDELELFIGSPVAPGAVLVDLLIYPAHVGVDDRSVARFLPGGEWILCDALRPYTGDLEPVGTGCPPTPGEPNACPGLVPAERASWGGVKSVYRP